MLKTSKGNKDNHKTAADMETSGSDPPKKKSF
jgi:hypothetical protein